LSGVLIHGNVPHDFRENNVISIPKNRNGNLTDFSNYRGISLSSVLNKMFDLIVLDRYYDVLI